MTDAGDESTLVGDESYDSLTVLPTGAGPRSRRARAMGALLNRPKLSRFDRYVVLDVLGHGGMGVVLKGYDEQLDRQVAIKVLHEDLHHRHTARLRREAQAMAKLSHPNVVQVYGVGEFEEQTFVAMELVKGQTVQAWMKQEPAPGWRACVELFLQLGEGLAAAHRQGLVHRDFKPSNAMVDEEGRARVLDFGLARQEDEDLDQPSEAELPKVGELLDASRDQPLTRTGAVMGTPAYMPREQMWAGEVDARSDQFSFCVALYEAVYGERPYQGDSILGLLESMKEGVAQVVPRKIDVPAALRKALVRGLSDEPRERWPSMDALLDELRAMVAPRSRRWVVLGLVAASVGLGGSWALGQYVQVKDRCTGAARKLVGIWDDERRQATQAAVLSTELPYAPGLWERVEPRLGAYAEAWEHKHTEVCEATTVRGEQSEAVMDLRMECLEKLRGDLRAVVGVLADADATVAENAVVLVESLPRLSRCDDVEALRAEVRPPEDPAVAEEVASLRTRIAELNAEHAAGRYESALRGVEPVVERAEQLGYAPLTAEARLLRGAVQSARGRFADSEHDGLGAYELATENRHDVVALRAVQLLTFVVGHGQARFAEGRVWGRTAMSLARRNKDDLALARSVRRLATVLGSQGNFEEARQYHQHALRIRESVLGPDHLDVAGSLQSLSDILHEQGEYEQAEQYQLRALRIRESVLGAEHPFVAISLLNVGNIYFSRGESERAKQHYERALRIWEGALDTEHPDIATTHYNLGAVSGARKEYEQAQWHFEQALKIRETVLGPEHPAVADSLSNLGRVFLEQEEYERARQYLERSLEIREKTLGSDHPNVAKSLIKIGALLRRQGDHAKAELYYLRVLEIREQALGSDHPAVAEILGRLAFVALDAGDVDAARERAERRVSIMEKADTSPPDLAQARFGLARVLGSDPSERRRARALALQARDVLGGYDDEWERARVDVERWLAEHP